MNELWYAYEPHDPNGRGRGIPLVLPWWTCWTISTVLGVMGLRTLLSGGTPDAYVNVAWALAAVLAWFVVRRLSWRASSTTPSRLRDRPADLDQTGGPAGDQ